MCRSVYRYVSFNIYGIMCINSMLQVVGVVDITTLNNRQYCIILDPVDKDGKPQLGQKRLVKVPVLFYEILYIREMT